MKRFLTVASSIAIAAGMAVLPVASFAQTGADAGKTAAPAAQTEAAPAATSTPVVSQDKTGPVKSAPAPMAKSDSKAPVAGKTTTHSKKIVAKHHATKAPVKNTAIKG